VPVAPAHGSGGAACAPALLRGAGLCRAGSPLAACLWRLDESKLRAHNRSIAPGCDTYS
jgi:hypothetical protein